MPFNLRDRIASKLKGSTSADRRSALEYPPGPAGIPLLGSLLQARRDPLRFALDLTRNYGDIARFRIGIYTGYLLNHPDHFQRVLKTHHRNYNKDNYNYQMLRPVLGEGLITADGDRWLHHRRLMQPVFQPKRTAHFDATVTRKTREMLDNWEKMATSGHPIPLAGEMMKLAFGIITESLFSTDLRASADTVERAFMKLNRDVAYRFKNVFVPPLWVPTPRNRAFKEALAELDRLVYDIIEGRRQESHPGEDLLGMLLAAQDDHTKEGMSDRQLRDEVMTLLLAGHETTANLLAWTCYLLSQHPAVTAKMQAELTGVFGSEQPTADDLPALNYTRAVLQESLRLYPPVWIISRKAIHEDVIGGYTVPAGTTVALCSYTLHRHPDFWEQPEAFRPERFYAEGETCLSNPAYFPFGGGPRICIGGHFAMMEAQLILAMIYQRYRLELAPGHPVEPEALVTLRPRYGLKMRVEEV